MFGVFYAVAKECSYQMKFVIQTITWVLHWPIEVWSHVQSVGYCKYSLLIFSNDEKMEGQNRLVFFLIQSIIVVQNEHFSCIPNVTVALLIWALFSFCCIFDDDDDNWPAAANCCLFFTTNNNNYITIFNIIIITRLVFPIKNKKKKCIDTIIAK